MKEIKSAETRTGMLTKSLRITHVLWATNEYLAHAGKREDTKCPLCSETGETNNHLKSTCPEETVKSLRNKMTTDIAALIQEQIGDHMPDEVWEALAAMWSQKRLREAHPTDTPVETTGVKCKTCSKGHRCRWKGKAGHLAEDVPGIVEEEPPSDEYEGLDENVRECLRDMAKPGARTTWTGWFPNSFSKLLKSFDIPARIAQELALQIRNVITQGMDDIWRERNTAQHHPNARKEINAKIKEAYEKKELLGLDQGPHREASDITSLPYKMKQKWLENTNQRIAKKEEENARRAAAVKALQTGCKWAWNPAANTKTKRARRRKETAPVMVTPWKAMATPNQTQIARKQTQPKKQTKGSDDAPPTVNSPWDRSPAAGPAGSMASAGSAPPAAKRAAGAAAAAAGAGRPGPSTAQCRPEPSNDLPRRGNDGNKKPQAPRTRKTPSQKPPTEKSVTTPETPGQDNDPDRIDDVV